MTLRLERHHHAKTKILATLGPATGTSECIKKLIHAGIDAVRLNFSHGSYEMFDSLYREIHQACVETSSPLAVLVDLQGPKIRIGNLAQPSYEIKDGDTLEITTEEVLGTNEKVSTSYKPLPKDAEIGDTILIDDGLIRLKIASKNETSVFCEVINGGILKPKKGMNLPGMNLSTPAVTEKDYKDIEFAVKHRVDYIALSFVRNAQDIIDLKDWLHKRYIDVPLIAKIEKPEALKNFEEILREADGIMVARGDLGVEMEPQEVPIVQKKIISRCNSVGKMVITATQMLESMINNPVPTRAEASDVANAVWDGTDAVMLSGETSVGKYPFKAVEIMDDIVTVAESNISLKRVIEYDELTNFEERLFDSVNKGIVLIAEQTKAAAIVVVTKKGRTAHNLAKYRPNARIIALSDDFETLNNLMLRWGVTSVFAPDLNKSKIRPELVKRILLENNILKLGDVFVIATGAPLSDQSRQNVLHIDVM